MSSNKKIRNYVLDYDAMKHAIVDKIVKSVDNLIIGNEGVYKNCLNCTHWNKIEETCGKFNNSRPPAHIIVNSCEEHLDKMDIPF